MKTGKIILIVMVVMVLLVTCSSVETYNKMVNKQEAVATAWSQVENVYQRRADLIPNLVSTVKGYANFEKSTLTAVIEARAKATQVTIDPSKMDAGQMQKFQAAQGELSSSLSRLMVVIEQYPNLKANENFIALQSQLEGTENRIAVERRRFNELAQGYNTYIRTFPNSIISGIANFEKKPYFEADKGAQKAPEVKF